MPPEQQSYTCEPPRKQQQLCRPKGTTHDLISLPKTCGRGTHDTPAPSHTRQPKRRVPLPKKKKRRPKECLQASPSGVCASQEISIFCGLQCSCVIRGRGPKGKPNSRKRTESLAETPGFENKLPPYPPVKNYWEMTLSRPQGTPNTQFLSNM